MAPLKFVPIEIPSNGIWQKAAPGHTPTRTAPLVRNFLVHTPGKLRARGGILGEPYALTEVAKEGTEKNIITHAWVFNDKLLIGFHKYQAVGTGYLPPWKTPYIKATEAQLAKSDKKLVFVNLTKGEATEIAIEEEAKCPGSNAQRIGSYVYGFAYWSSENEEVNGGFQSKRPLLRWDGTATKPTILVNAPQAGQAVKAHLNRLWVLGGRNAAKPIEFIKVPFKTSIVPAPATHTYIASLDSESGGLTGLEQYFPIGAEVKGSKLAAGTKVLGYGSASSGSHYVWCEGLATEEVKEVAANTLESKAGVAKIEPSTLYWSDEFGPSADDKEFWKDDVSGLYNTLIIGDDDQNDFGVALAVVNNVLIIFKRHSIWALYGYSPTTFQVRNLTKERGCVDPSSVLEMDSGVYFLGQQGFEFFDGSQFHTISDPVAPIVAARTSRWAGEANEGVPAKEHFGRITTCYMGNGYIMLNMAAQHPGSSAGQKGADAGGALTLYVHAPTGNWAQFTMNTAVLEGADIITNVGTSPITPWIYDGRFLHPISGITDDNVASAHDAGPGKTRVIPLKIVLDRINLSSPTHRSQIHRMFLDYAWGAEPGKLAFYMLAYAGSGAEVMKKQELLANELLVPDPLEGNNPGASHKYGKRFIFDDFNECTDIQIVIEREDNAEPIQGEEVEVYDGGIEYQTTYATHPE